MNKYCLLIIALVFPFLIYAQTNTIVSKPYEVIDAKYKFYFHNGNDVITAKVSMEQRMVTLQKFDAKTLELIKTKKYVDFPYGSFFEDILKVKDRIFLFYSYWDREKKEQLLVSREIDVSKGEFLSNEISIVKVGEELIRKNDEMFHFFLSKDSSKVLVQYQLTPRKASNNKNYDVMGLIVLDQNLKMLFEKQEEMPYSESKMNNLNYLVDSEGHVFLLMGVYNSNIQSIRDRDGKLNYHIEVLRIFENSVSKNYELPFLEDKLVNKVALIENVSEGLIGAGYYNRGNNKEDVDGIVYFKISPEGKISNIKYYEIPLEILNQYTSTTEQKRNERKDEKGNAEFKALELRELRIRLDDGNLFIIGEQCYSASGVSAMSMDGGMGGSSTPYNYNDIHITKIDQDGKLKWMKKLPKRQFTRKGGTVYSFKVISNRPVEGVSFKCMKGKENYHYFLFVDNPDNRNLDINKAPLTHVDGPGILTAYLVNDSDGDFKKIPILDMTNFNKMELLQFDVGRILPMSENEFLLEEYKKNKEDVLIKVTFTE